MFEDEVTMTVEELCKLCRFSTIVLKDSYNGREYRSRKTVEETMKDRTVTRIFPRMDCDKNGSYARPVLVAWVHHVFEGEER